MRINAEQYFREAPQRERHGTFCPYPAQGVGLEPQQPAGMTRGLQDWETQVSRIPLGSEPVSNSGRRVLSV